MDEIDMLRQYAARTEFNEAPPIDVTDQVLATIRQQRARPDCSARAQRPMLLAAAASFLVAASLGVVAQQLVADMQDPLVSLFTPLVVTLQ
jgi:hypothetical protein